MPSFKPIAVNTAGATVPYEAGQFIIANVSFTDGTTTYDKGVYLDNEGKRQQYTTQGPPGENAVPYTISGQVDNASELPTPTQELIGTAYFVGTTTPRNVYFCVEYNGTVQWEDQGQIEGPQGPQGEKGETGATGAQGPQGIQGPVGIAYRHEISITEEGSDNFEITCCLVLYNNSADEINSLDKLLEYCTNGCFATGFIDDNEGSNRQYYIINSVYMSSSAQIRFNGFNTGVLTGSSASPYAQVTYQNNQVVVEDHIYDNISSTEANK